MRRILIIDDDVLSSELIKCFLVEDEFNLSVEYTGDSGIDLVREQRNFDLILLDINLPGIDGFEVFAEIKKIDTAMPIVAYTALCDSAIMKKCDMLGFDDVILKPTNFSEIRSKVFSNCRN